MLKLKYVKRGKKKSGLAILGGGNKPNTFLEIAKEFNNRSTKRKTNADVVRSIILRLAEEGKIEAKQRGSNAPSFSAEELNLLKKLYIKKEENGNPITWKKIADEFNKAFPNRNLDQVNASYQVEKIVKAGELEKIDRSVNRNKRKGETE